MLVRIVTMPIIEDAMSESGLRAVNRFGIPGNVLAFRNLNGQLEALVEMVRPVEVEDVPDITERVT